MFNRAAMALALLVALCLAGQPADAQASSFSTWVDANYDFEVYWGSPATVYDLYVVYDTGRERPYHRYTSSSSLSAQMRDFAEGRTPSGVVDWYYEKRYEVVTWNYYQTYKTRALANSNADWIESMGLQTDVRMIYNPIYSGR